VRRQKREEIRLGELRLERRFIYARQKLSTLFGGLCQRVALAQKCE